MPFDLVIRERLVGCALVLTSVGTPSIQNLGPSGPQRIDFVLCNQGMLRQPVLRGTHWSTRQIYISHLIGDKLVLMAWNLKSEIEFYAQLPNCNNEDIPVNKQAIPSRKSHCLPKRECVIYGVQQVWGTVRKNIISDRFSTKTAISAHI